MPLLASVYLGSQSSRLRSAVGSVGSREPTSDSEPSLSPWRRNSCTSSHGGSPGLACAEWGTNSTGSAGSRLTRTRELRLHPLAMGLDHARPGPPTPPRGPPGAMPPGATAPRFSGPARPVLWPRKSSLVWWLWSMPLKFLGPGLSPSWATPV